jgi:hypothetical protein
MTLTCFQAAEVTGLPREFIRLLCDAELVLHCPAGDATENKILIDGDSLAACLRSVTAAARRQHVRRVLEAV